MAYTNNIPQANQQIAITQGPIQNNFDYIQKAVGQEHNFVANDTDPTHTYHLQASMPNQVDPIALPASTAGIYYVSSGKPKFYNTAVNFLVNSTCDSYFASGGPISVNGVSITSFYTVPDNSAGSIWLIRTGSSDTYFVGNYIASNGVVVPLVSNRSRINVVASGTNLVLGAIRTDAVGTFSTIKWIVQVNAL